MYKTDLGCAVLVIRSAQHGLVVDISDGTSFLTVSTVDQVRRHIQQYRANVGRKKKAPFSRLAAENFTNRLNQISNDNKRYFSATWVYLDSSDEEIEEAYHDLWTLIDMTEL